MKVAAVIPAYNEEKTVAQVIEIVQQVQVIGEVIVVSDGSTDGTAAAAFNQGAVVVALEQNVGKGGAMVAGMAKTKAEVILFLDADLIGLTKQHINDLLTSVLSQEAEMTVGIFEGGRVSTELAQKIAPFLSGQRAMRREILESISHLDLTRFGVEAALTNYAQEKGLRVKEVLLPDLTHLMKEEKLGLVKGFVARMKMYWEIAKYLKKE